MYNTMEMELIAYLYGFMSKEDKLNWSMKDAEDLYEDEIGISYERGYEFVLESAEVVYDTIKDFIAQDIEDDEL